MNAGDMQVDRGHKEPCARQFSVFLANRVGQLKDMLDVFAAEDLRVLGISVVDSTDWAVIRTVVSDAGKAREVLARRNMPFTESDVLLACLGTEDAMSEICGLLLQAEISIHFAYPLVISHDGNPVLVLHVDDPILAKQILVRHEITLLGDEDLANSI